jgi:FkbM family methyltransferase
MNLNRRTFLPWLGGGVSSSFLMGLLGGLGVGSAGATVSARAARGSGGTMSYAQQGEDLAVDVILDHLRIKSPTYLDVGACDPVHLSNTYLFYARGCRGVLVEPNPKKRAALVAGRPRDTVLSVGVGPRGESLDFYVIGGEGGLGLDTFDREMAEGYTRKLGPWAAVHHVVKVPLVPINEVIERHFRVAPDFLSVDTEGMDLAILRSLDFDRFRPAVVCAETLVFGTDRVETKILDLMVAKGYEVRGGTFVNTIFVDGSRLAAG